MTGMQDIFGPGWIAAYNKHEADGRVTIRSHPDFPNLKILNYTPKTAYEGAWDKYTLAARGLIYDSSDGTVLAHPFKKFFNYGQAGAPTIDLDQEVYAANKYDGSLGIAYMQPNGVPAIATRGSFSSEQAIHATQVLLTEGRDSFEYDLQWVVEELEDGWTPLFEIIYPENRIVLDYGDRDYLQYLGSIRNASGAFFTAEDERVTFGELLSRAPRPNAEGYVVWLDRYTAVKLKQEDYVELHKIVTGLNEKVVWREVQKGEPSFSTFVASLPDELQPWAERVGRELNAQLNDELKHIDHLYVAATETAWNYTTGPFVERKTFALAVQDTVPSEYRGYMFGVADGKDILSKLWRNLEPVGNRSFKSVQEDA